MLVKSTYFTVSYLITLGNTSWCLNWDQYALKTKLKETILKSRQSSDKSVEVMEVLNLRLMSLKSLQTILE